MQSRSQSPRYPCPAERETRDSGTDVEKVFHDSIDNR